LTALLLCVLADIVMLSARAHKRLVAFPLAKGAAGRSSMIAEMNALLPN
jgi:hypothetical protein